MKKWAVAAAGLLGVGAVILAGVAPDSYLEHVLNLAPPQQPYPAGMVLWLTLWMALQAWCVVAILRPTSYSRSWGRALGALLTSFQFHTVGVLLSLHKSPTSMAYLVWALLVLLALSLLSLWSLVAAARHAHA